ncbi:MAG: AraC family transcriptional regulator [Rhodospirillaceae bacterium]
MRNIPTFKMHGTAEPLGFAIRDHSRVTRTEKPHRHDFFQLRLDIRGEADHQIGCRRRVLTAGSVSFIAPYRIHRGGRGASSQFFVINFHHRFLRPGLAVDSACHDTWPLTTAPELLPFAFQEFLDFQLDGHALEIAVNACRSMLAHVREQRLFSHDLLRADLLRLIGAVCQRYERDLLALQASTAGSGFRRGALPRVIGYITAHLTNDIALADVAAASDVSPSYVTQLLKKETGKTFVDFVTQLRLQKAQELLAATSLRVSEIASAVGYADDAYFARRFRQYLRVSPSEYRRTVEQPRGRATN